MTKNGITDPQKSRKYNLLYEEVRGDFLGDYATHKISCSVDK